MRARPRAIAFILAVGSAAAPAASAATTGVESLVPGPTLVDLLSNLAFFQVAPGQAARFRLQGPAVYEIDARANLGLKEVSNTMPTLEIATEDGSTIAEMKVPGTPGTGIWDAPAIRPGAPLLFHLEAPGASNVFQIRVDGTVARGIAVRFTPLDPSRVSPTSRTLVKLPRPPPSNTDSLVLLGESKLSPEGLDRPANWATKEIPSGRWSILAGATTGRQREEDAFSAAEVAGFVLSARRSLSNALHVDVEWDGRFGRATVPLVNDVASGTAASSDESRHRVSTAFGGQFSRHGESGWRLSASGDLGYEYDRTSDRLAPRTAGFAEARVGLGAGVEAAALFVSFSVGLPMHDDTPSTLVAGTVRSHVEMSGGLRMRLREPVGLVFAYRGERLTREFSVRRSDQFLGGLTLDF